MIILQTPKNLSKTISLSQQEKINWMKRLLSKAKLLGESGEVPIAAVILDKKGRCIGDLEPASVIDSTYFFC